MNTGRKPKKRGRHCAFSYFLATRSVETEFNFKECLPSSLANSCMIIGEVLWASFTLLPNTIQRCWKFVPDVPPGLIFEPRTACLVGPVTTSWRWPTLIAWRVKRLSKCSRWQESRSFAMWRECTGTRLLAESSSSTSCSIYAKSTKRATNASFGWWLRPESTSFPPWTLMDMKKLMWRWVKWLCVEFRCNCLVVRRQICWSCQLLHTVVGILYIFNLCISICCICIYVEKGSMGWDQTNPVN